MSPPRVTTRHRRTLRIAVHLWAVSGVLLLAALLPAQSAAPGHRVCMPLQGTDTWLLDNRGQIVHAWPGTAPPGLAVYVDTDGTLLRAVETRPSSLAGSGGGLQRVAFDGTVVWDFRYDDPGVLSHHDIAVLPNGNVLMIAWEDKTPAEAIAAGRDPALLGSVLRPDHVIEVLPTGPASGQIVWAWHAWDHLIQDFDPAQANFGVVEDHPELIDVNYPRQLPSNGDWMHANGIDYDPVHDRIVLSLNWIGEIWVIDHSTTTAEAASHSGGRWGKGGDLLYRWGNPEAYRAGSPAERVSIGQHAPTFVPTGCPGAGNIVVFLNRVFGGLSEVWEITPPLDPSGAFVPGSTGRYGPSAPVWRFSEPGLYSPITSSAQRLPNGNTLICSGAQHRVFEVTAAGTTVMDFSAPGVFTTLFNAQYVERSLWSDTSSLSLSAGGSVGLDLVAGSARAGETYLVLGSVSGTSPGTPVLGASVPLNFDVWTQLTLSLPNTPFFMNTLGTLDATGRADASLFNVAGGALPATLAGVPFHHAFVTLDASATITHASNPVRVELAP